MPGKGNRILLFALFQVVLLSSQVLAGPIRFDQMDRERRTYLGEIIDRAEKMKLDLDPVSVLEEIALAAPLGRLAMGAKVAYRQGFMGTAHAGMSCQAIKSKTANSLFADTETLSRCYQSDPEFKNLDQKRRAYLAKNFAKPPSKNDMKCDKDEISFTFSGKKVRAVFHPVNTDSTGQRQLNFFEIPRADSKDLAGGIKIHSRVNICTDGLCKWTSKPDLKDISVNGVAFVGKDGQPMNRISFPLGEHEVPTVGTRDIIARSLAKIRLESQDGKSAHDLANLLMTPEYFLLHRDHILSFCEKSVTEPTGSLRKEQGK